MRTTPADHSADTAYGVHTMFGIGLGPDPDQVARTWTIAGSSIGMATTGGVALQGLPYDGPGTVGAIDRA